MSKSLTMLVHLDNLAMRKSTNGEFIALDVSIMGYGDLTEKKCVQYIDEAIGRGEFMIAAQWDDIVDPEEIFVKTNSIDTCWAGFKRTRSTSVGDLVVKIIKIGSVEIYEVLLCAGIGWQQIKIDLEKHFGSLNSFQSKANERDTVFYSTGETV